MDAASEDGRDGMDAKGAGEGHGRRLRREE
jgi:hypothetical protein